MQIYVKCIYYVIALYKLNMFILIYIIDSNYKW